MTPSELKYQVEQSGHESYFFTRKTMSFFGDTMKNYGVRTATIWRGYGDDRRQVEVWELYRRRAVKHGLKDPAYFDKVTFECVFEAK
jgi:hypothetical protein